MLVIPFSLEYNLKCRGKLKLKPTERGKRFMKKWQVTFLIYSNAEGTDKPVEFIDFHVYADTKADAIIQASVRLVNEGKLREGYLLSYWYKCKSIK